MSPSAKSHGPGKSHGPNLVGQARVSACVERSMPGPQPSGPASSMATNAMSSAPETDRRHRHNADERAFMPRRIPLPQSSPRWPACPAQASGVIPWPAESLTHLRVSGLVRVASVMVDTAQIATCKRSNGTDTIMSSDTASAIGIQRPAPELPDAKAPAGKAEDGGCSPPPDGNFAMAWWLMALAVLAAAALLFVLVADGRHLTTAPVSA